ncbi:MAG: hypothetical protein AAGC58_12725 [Asticcacaulis sp.]
MKTLFRLFVSALFLTLAPFAAQAQESSLLAKDKPIDDPANIPATSMYLMLVSYSCQEVAGVENYTEIKKLTHNLTSTIMQDEAKADEFVNMIEGMAKESCPDTKTCWRDFNDLPATATREQGEETCLTNINNGLTLMGKQMENLLASAGVTSSSAAPQ